MATTEEEVEFRAADLIGSAGTGANGEKLVNTLTDSYPPELDAAMQKRVNSALTADLDRADVAKVIGVNEVADAKVRGGERDPDDAVVTYVWIDQKGVTWKGCFPYPDLAEGETDDHISQRDSILNSTAARDHLAATAKAQAAGASSEDVDALRSELEELRAKVDQPAADPLPVDQYDKANAADIAKMVGAADRDTAQRVLDYEQGHENRKTVIEAAQKRIVTLDDEAAEEAKRQDELAKENDELKARIAELEAQATAKADPPTGDGKTGGDTPAETPADA